MEKHPYTAKRLLKLVEIVLASKSSSSAQPAGAESFGQRLARLRKAAGYSQRDFAAELGSSQRMVAYYEVQSQRPPTHLLPRIAELLGISSDELLGLKPLAKSKRAPDSRLWRRFKEVEALPPPQKRQVVQLLDALLERERLRKRAG